jgi:hypothetical protein
VSKDRPGWNAAAIVLWYWFSERNGSRESLSKNKVPIFGVFLATRKHAANSPRLPRKLPQLHQRITTPKTHKSAKTPVQKREKPHHPPRQKNIAKVSSQPLSFFAYLRVDTKVLNDTFVQLLVSQTSGEIATVSTFP